MKLRQPEAERLRLGANPGLGEVISLKKDEVEIRQF
jgi:hypothetical protein